MPREQKPKMEYRYYEIPVGEYVLPKLGKGWEQEYGLGLGRMLHFHNHLEIGYCYHGDGEMIISDTSFFYHGGEFTLIPANIPHTTISAPGNICKWEYLFIDMDAFLREIVLRDDPGRDCLLHLLSSRGFFLQESDAPPLARLIRRMLEECRVRKSFQKECLIALLAELTVEMLRLCEATEEIHPGKQQETGYLEEAIRFIYANYCRDIQVSDIASACGLSESHFRRLFTKSLQTGPLDFLNTIRIQEACRLMETSDKPIREVAIQVGYETISTFNRNFRRSTGMSPLEWRKTKRRPSSSLQDFQIDILKGWEGKETGAEEEPGPDPGPGSAPETENP